jgi:DNA-binding ferritin-like protein (Dps family)
LAKYPNFETPELNLLQMEEIKQWRRFSENLEVMPEDYNSIFEALRMKVVGKQSKSHKCKSFCKNLRCFKKKNDNE